MVLVHGAWHGPWCWTHVAGALDARGHSVEALCLPKHDRPGTRGRIWSTVRSYVDALAEVASTKQSPTLVGHSMGGYVVQRYLESNDAAHAVLVASVPSKGILGANLRAFRHRPTAALAAALLVDYSYFVRTEELVRDQFFTSDTSADVVATCYEQLQNESAIAINTMVVRRPRPKRVRTPVTVVAAKHDGIFTSDEQRELANAYGADPVVVDGGHDVMLDMHWPALVDTIDAAATRSVTGGRP